MLLHDFILSLDFIDDLFRDGISFGDIALNPFFQDFNYTFCDCFGARVLLDIKAIVHYDCVFLVIGDINQVKVHNIFEVASVLVDEPDSIEVFPNQRKGVQVQINLISIF